MLHHRNVCHQRRKNGICNSDSSKTSNFNSNHKKITLNDIYAPQQYVLWPAFYHDQRYGPLSNITRYISILHVTVDPCWYFLLYAPITPSYFFCKIDFSQSFCLQCSSLHSKNDCSIFFTFEWRIHMNVWNHTWRMDFIYLIHERSQLLSDSNMNCNGVHFRVRIACKNILLFIYFICSFISILRDEKSTNVNCSYLLAKALCMSIHFHTFCHFSFLIAQFEIKIWFAQNPHHLCPLYIKFYLLLPVNAISQERNWGV